MDCEYQHLCSCPQGYVARCVRCGIYEIAFISTLVMLKADDFSVFIKMVTYKSLHEQKGSDPDLKCMVVETPVEGFCMILTRREACQLAELLERADTEARAQDLLGLFRE